MPRSGMKVLNKAGVLGMFDSARNINEKAVEKGLKKGGLVVMANSMEQTPVDTGALRGSHRVSHEGAGYETKVKVELLQSYAIYVHEDPDAQHAPGTNYKFLSRALRDNIKTIRGFILGK